MNNVFDALQDNTFSIINEVMGCSVRWVEEDGSIKGEAKALYNHPSSADRISNTDYNPDQYSIEYKQNDLPGLKEAVNGRETAYLEVLLNGSWVRHWGQSVDTKYDGKTIIINLSAP